MFKIFHSLPLPTTYISSGSQFTFWFRSPGFLGGLCQSCSLSCLSLCTSSCSDIILSAPLRTSKLQWWAHLEIQNISWVQDQLNSTCLPPATSFSFVIESAYFQHLGIKNRDVCMLPTMRFQTSNTHHHILNTPAFNVLWHLNNNSSIETQSLKLRIVCISQWFIF